MSELKIGEPEGFLDDDSVENLMDTARVHPGYGDKLEYDDLLNVVYSFYLHILAQKQIINELMDYVRLNE